MSKTPYQPPSQSKAGMIIDSIFLLVLVYAALMAPLLLTTGGGEEAAAAGPAGEEAAITWESLGQNESMAAQWQKLGMAPEDAAPIINDKFDYTIKAMPLIGTILVIVGYFFFMLKVSEKEYRDVIGEKFNSD